MPAVGLSLPPCSATIKSVSHNLGKYAEINYELTLNMKLRMSSAPSAPCRQIG
jgi:hypothetical protein